jgi:hypothetical protein
MLPLHVAGNGTGSVLDGSSWERPACPRRQGHRPGPAAELRDRRPLRLPLGMRHRPGIVIGARGRDDPLRLRVSHRGNPQCCRRVVMSRQHYRGVRSHVVLRPARPVRGLRRRGMAPGGLRTARAVSADAGPLGTRCPPRRVAIEALALWRPSLLFPAPLQRSVTSPRPAATKVNQAHS